MEPTSHELVAPTFKFLSMRIPAGTLLTTLSTGQIRNCCLNEWVHRSAPFKEILWFLNRLSCCCLVIFLPPVTQLSLGIGRGPRNGKVCFQTTQKRLQGSPSRPQLCGRDIVEESCSRTTLDVCSHEVTPAARPSPTSTHTAGAATRPGRRPESPSAWICILTLAISLASYSASPSFTS